MSTIPTHKEIGFVGKGYDVFGQYCSIKSTRAQILDQASLIAKNGVSKFDGQSSSTTKLISGRTTTAFGLSLASSVHIEGQLGFYKGESTAAFEGNTEYKENTLYVSARSDIRLFRVTLNWQTIASSPEEFFDPTFKTQYNSIIKDEAAFDWTSFFNAYGLYVVGGVWWGGAAVYNQYVTDSTLTSEAKIKMQVEASYDAIAKKALFKSSSTYSASFAKENFAQQEELHLLGNPSAGVTIQMGENSGAEFKTWAEGIPSAPAIFDYADAMHETGDSTPLIPIWELFGTHRDTVKTHAQEWCEENGHLLPYSRYDETYHAFNGYVVCVDHHGSPLWQVPEKGGDGVHRISMAYAPVEGSERLYVAKLGDSPRVLRYDLPPDSSAPGDATQSAGISTDPIAAPGMLYSGRKDVLLVGSGGSVKALSGAELKELSDVPSEWSSANGGWAFEFIDIEQDNILASVNGCLLWLQLSGDGSQLTKKDSNSLPGTGYGVPSIAAGSVDCVTTLWCAFGNKVTAVQGFDGEHITPYVTFGGQNTGTWTAPEDVTGDASHPVALIYSVESAMLYVCIEGYLYSLDPKTGVIINENPFPETGTGPCGMIERGRTAIRDVQQLRHESGQRQPPGD